jgi:hypothetical protein
MAANEPPSGDFAPAPVAPTGEAQALAEHLEAIVPRAKSGRVEASTDPRAVPHVAGILLLNGLEGQGVAAAATIRTRLSELDTEMPFAELHEVAAQYEEERLASTDQRTQIEAQANGELARAVGSTASMVAVWYTRGAAEAQSLLPVARNFVAKVEQMEVPKQAADYLTSVLDDIEVEGQAPPEE